MRFGFALLASVALTGMAHAQTAPQVAPQPAPQTAPQAGPDAAAAAAARAAANAMPDTPGTGPYPALREVDAGLARHVVYRPADLAKLGNRKLGVLVWGNGGCSDDGASARFHLAEIASHGYLVVAPGIVMSGPGAAARPQPRPADPNGPRLAVETSADDVRTGLDWALAENVRKGSRYYSRIDPKAVAVAGHSCGGLQALQLAGDPRISAVIVHNSGVFTDGSNPISGMKVDKALLKTLHTPVLYVLGGPTDIAYPNGTDDFHKIDHVPAMLLNLEVGHGGTFRQPNGGLVGQVSVQWLEWQLRGDKTAARTFTGADCTLCADPQWKVERKGIN